MHTVFNFVTVEFVRVEMYFEYLNMVTCMSTGINLSRYQRRCHGKALIGLISSGEN
jgi:hypothetical protein